MSKEDVSDIVSPKVGLDAENSSSSGKGTPNMSQVESKLQNPPNPWSLEDNMSILRFKTAITSDQNQSTIGISNCGFEVTVIKQKQKSKNDSKDQKKQKNE